MKTIDERAKEWVDSLGAGLVHPYNRQAMIDAYIAGAKAQYEELTAHYEAEIAKYKCDLEESRERENIACKAVAEKRDKIARLTKWHDPNITPDDNKPVIICTSPGIYYIAAYDKQFDYWFTGNGSFYQHEIIGWREIH